MKKRSLGCLPFLLSLLLTFQLVLPSTGASAMAADNNILPPSNLTLQLVTPSDIKLTWSSVYGAASYNVYGITDGQLILLGTTTSTAYTFNNLPQGSYRYVVSTTSTAGESGPCAPVSADVVYPDMASPGNLTVKIQNGNDIVLSWTASQYAQTYNIFLIAGDGQKTLAASTKTNTYTFTNAAAGNYTYAVSAANPLYGESSLTAPAQVQVVFPVMTAPSNLTYSILNGNDITLKWNPVSYASSYKIYQIIDGQKVLKSTITGTNTTYANMPADDYEYEVHSYSDRFGESETGSQTSLTLTLPVMQAPGNFTYTTANGNDIVLKWDAVPYAASYKIYQIVDGQKVLKSTLGGTTTTYANMPGGDYVYEVYSYNSRFGESQEGSSLTFSLVLPVMQPPANVIQTIKNATEFSLKWDAVPYATGYKVYQIIDGQRVLKNTVAIATVTYSNMLPGDYSYEIHSYSSRFGESADGSSVAVTLNGQTMQAPTNLTYTVTNGNDITLKWTAAQFATSYKVYQVIDGQPVLKQTTAGVNVTFTNMPEGSYDYIVTSVSTLLGESPTGSEITFSLVYPEMAAPTNLAYKLQNGNDVVLTWSPATYAGSYRIYELVNGEPVLKTTVYSTTTTITKVPEGDHTYIVKSVSSRFGESLNGSQVSLSIVYSVMLAPGNLTYSIANGNDITLRWDPSNYATAYKIYQVIDSQKILKQTVYSTSVTFTNMPAGDYTYEVCSYSDRFGESQQGSQSALTLVFPVMQAPDGFTYTVINGNDITLKWLSAPYASNYKIYQVVDGKKVLKQTVIGTAFTFSNMPEGDYTYEIHSYSSRFGESQEGSQTSLALVFPTMQPPVNLTDSILNGNDISIRWNASAYATNYRIYQIIDGQKVLKQTVTGTSATFINMPAGDYTFAVNSYSSRFGESAADSTINVSLVWPVVPPPVLSGTVFNVNNITLSWQKVNWATEYRVYEVTDGTQQLLYKGTALSWKIYNLSEATHTFQVTAYNTRFGESDPSNQLTETVIYPVMQPPAASLKLLDKTSAQIYWDFVTYANGYNVYEIIDNVPVLLAKNLNNLSYTVSGLSYANHQFYVTSYSNSFGESDSSNIVTAKLITDTVPPVTSADTTSGWTNENRVAVNLTAADNETGVAATYYSINDGAFIQGTSFVISEEGINKVSFYSVDKAGNKEAIKTTCVKIDRTAPLTASNAPAGWTSEAVTINLNAADTQSGIAKTFYSIDGSAFLEGTSFTIQSEGIHTIIFYSVDAAGNIEPANTADVKIDKTAPEITMNLLSEYKLGTELQLNYSAIDSLSGIAGEKLLVYGPNDTTRKQVSNGTVIKLDKPGVYTIIAAATDAAGHGTTIQKQFVVYIPANIEVTPKVIKGNNGVFTVRVNLPSGFDTQGFDLNTATLNGVKALTSNNGYYNQAKIGQFKFERSDFNWTSPEVTVEFRCYVNGYLVIGQTTVKVQK